MGRSEDGPRQWPGNLEAQSAVAAAILRELLKSGILRSDLSVDQFRADIRSAGYPDPADFEGLFSDLMIWLRDEGIIRFGQISGDGKGGDLFHDVVITGFGMNLLGKKLDSLGGVSSAEIIMEDKNASASQFVRFGGLLGGIIGGFTKAIS